jgi:hypothetical protein
VAQASEVIASWLSTITYKPGWELRSRHSAKHGTVITVLLDAPSRERPAEQIRIRGTFIAPDILAAGTEAEFTEWMKREVFTAVELHELDEFLRSHGQLVTDRHEGQVVRPERDTEDDSQVEHNCIDWVGAN